MRLLRIWIMMIAVAGLIACQQEAPDPEKAEVKNEVAAGPKAEAPAVVVETMVEPVEKVAEAAKERVEAAVTPAAEVGVKEPEKKIESVVLEPTAVAEVKQAAVNTPAAAKPASTPAASGDVVAGGKLAKGKCGACHYFDQAKKKVGPSLMGIYGRAPSIEGISFAAWDAASLDAWLENPKAVKPKTKMGFKGIPEKDKRDDIIAYLKTL